MVAPEKYTKYNKSRGFSQLSKQNQIALSFVYSLVLIPLSLIPAQTQEIRSHNAKATISKDLHMAGKSDATAGVQLLEHIFSRVMNSPQVAINLSTSSQMLLKSKQAKQQQQTSQQGIDYKLAIRPKETGKAFAAPSPSLQLIAQAPAANESMPVPPSAQRQLAAANSADSSAGDDLAATENWRGSALQRSIALKPEALDKPGVWDREAAANAPLASPVSTATAARSIGQSNALPSTNMGKFIHQPGDNMYSPPSFSNSKARSRMAELPSFEEARRKAPELANAVNRLYKVSKRIDDVQSLADGSRPKIASAETKAGWYSSPHEMQIIDERPVVKDFRGYDESRRVESALGSSQDGPQGFGSAAGGMISSSGGGGGAGAGANGSSVAVRGRLMAKTHNSKPLQKQGSEQEHNEKAASKKEDSSADKDSGYTANDFKLNSRDNRLALLPPNVATGIPLVSLGTSEAQATHALSSGKLHQQTIGKWSSI